MHNDSYSTFFNTSQDLSIYRCSGYNPGTSSSCSCSDSYAGEYRCTSRSTLIIRNGHGRGYGSLDEIPSGASVQVSKGDGTWTHVSYNGISDYSSMQYLERADTNHRPIFHLDSCTSSEGAITVSGWTYDQDAPNESMSVHIYVDNTFNADLDDAAFVLHDHVVTEAASPIDLNLLKTVVRNSENLNQDDFSRGMDALQTSLDRARDVLNIPESEERVYAGECGGQRSQQRFAVSAKDGKHGSAGCDWLKMICEPGRLLWRPSYLFHFFISGFEEIPLKRCKPPRKSLNFPLLLNCIVRIGYNGGTQQGRKFGS